MDGVWAKGRPGSRFTQVFKADGLGNIPSSLQNLLTNAPLFFLISLKRATMSPDLLTRYWANPSTDL